MLQVLANQESELKESVNHATGTTTVATSEIITKCSFKAGIQVKRVS